MQKQKDTIYLVFIHILVIASIVLQFTKLRSTVEVDGQLNVVIDKLTVLSLIVSFAFLIFSAVYLAVQKKATRLYWYMFGLAGGILLFVEYVLR